MDEIVILWKKIRKMFGKKLNMNERDESMVQCGDCKLFINKNQLENHLEICTTKAEEPNEVLQQARKNETQGKRYQVPFYKSITDKQLRVMLSGVGLLNGGDRELMQKRHREFILRCTVEQDKMNPASESDIAQQVNLLFPNPSKPARGKIGKFFDKNTPATKPPENPPENSNDIFKQLINQTRQRKLLIKQQNSESVKVPPLASSLGQQSSQSSQTEDIQILCDLVDENSQGNSEEINNEIEEVIVISPPQSTPPTQTKVQSPPGLTVINEQQISRYAYSQLPPNWRCGNYSFFTSFVWNFPNIMLLMKCFLTVFKNLSFLISKQTLVNLNTPRVVLNTVQTPKYPLHRLIITH